jgi:hypothetical protein
MKDRDEITGKAFWENEPEQPETLPDKLARLIRENPGMPVKIFANGFVFERELKDVSVLSNGTIAVTIGTP